MDAKIVGQFWVKRRSPDHAVTHEDRFAAVASHDLNARSEPFDVRRSNENRVKRLVQAVDCEVGFEGIDLTPIRVAPNHCVERAEATLIGSPIDDFSSQQNHAGTGPEHG